MMCTLFCIHHLDMSWYVLICLDMSWYLHLQFPAFCWYLFMFCSLFMQLSCESHLWYAWAYWTSCRRARSPSHPQCMVPTMWKFPTVHPPWFPLGSVEYSGGFMKGLASNWGIIIPSHFWQNLVLINIYIYFMSKYKNDYGLIRCFVSFGGVCKVKKKIYRMIWTHYSFPNDSPGSSAIATMSFPGRSRAFPVFRGRHALS